MGLMVNCTDAVARRRCLRGQLRACAEPRVAAADRRGWPVNPPSWHAVWAAGFGPAGRPVVEVRRLYGLGGGFELLEFDLVAECFELALESAGAVFGRVAVVLPVGS